MPKAIPLFKVGALLRVMTEDYLLACLVATGDNELKDFHEMEILIPKQGDVVLYIGPDIGRFTSEDEHGIKVIETVYHRFLYKEKLLDIFEDLGDLTEAFEIIEPNDIKHE